VREAAFRGRLARLKMQRQTERHIRLHRAAMLGVLQTQPYIATASLGALPYSPALPVAGGAAAASAGLLPDIRSPRIPMPDVSDTSPGLLPDIGLSVAAVTAVTAVTDEIAVTAGRSGGDASAGDSGVGCNETETGDFAVVTVPDETDDQPVTGGFAGGALAFRRAGSAVAMRVGKAIHGGRAPDV